MSRIDAVEASLFRVPLTEVLANTKHGAHTHFELITTTVRLVDGTQGARYRHTGGRGGHSILAMITQDFAPFLAGRDAQDVEALHEAMQWHIHYVGRGGVASIAISAIDIALWDVRGKRLGLPLWKMAGGAGNKCSAYRGGIELNFPMDMLLASVRDYLERGFNGVKIKVGKPDLADDVERVRVVRVFIGPDVVLMVDANYAFSVEPALVHHRTLLPRHRHLRLECGKCYPCVRRSQRLAFGSAVIVFGRGYAGVMRGATLSYEMDA